MTVMIRQGIGEGTCSGCVAAMITGETLDDVYEYMGSWVIPFHTGKIFSYLLSRGVIPGYCVNSLSKQFDSKNEFNGYKLDLSTSQPAYVIVDNERPSKPHAIYWDGRLVWDPQLTGPTADLHNYKIVSWTPLYIPGEPQYPIQEEREHFSVSGATVTINQDLPRRVHPGPPLPITLVN